MLNLNACFYDKLVVTIIKKNQEEAFSSHETDFFPLYFWKQGGTKVKEPLKPFIKKKNMMAEFVKMYSSLIFIYKKKKTKKNASTFMICRHVLVTC